MRGIQKIIWLSCLVLMAGTAWSQTSDKDQKVIADFEARVKAYHVIREGLERGLPKLPTDATPEQIESHKTSLQRAVRARRKGARCGELFTRPAAALIQRLVAAEFTDWEGSELRKDVLGAENKNVPLKINAAYPPSAEQVEMPPALLLALPQLPKSLRYRFVGRSLVLLDRENALIIDYMRNALR